MRSSRDDKKESLEPKRKLERKKIREARVPTEAPIAPDIAAKEKPTKRKFERRQMRAPEERFPTSPKAPAAPKVPVVPAEPKTPKATAPTIEEKKSATKEKTTAKLSTLLEDKIGLSALDKKMLIRFPNQIMRDAFVTTLGEIKGNSKIESHGDDGILIGVKAQFKGKDQIQITFDDDRQLQLFLSLIGVEETNLKNNHIIRPDGGLKLCFYNSEILAGNEQYKPVSAFLRGSYIGAKPLPSTAPAKPEPEKKEMVRKVQPKRAMQILDSGEIFLYRSEDDELVAQFPNKGVRDLFFAKINPPSKGYPLKSSAEIVEDDKIVLGKLAGNKGILEKFTITLSGLGQGALLEMLGIKAKDFEKHFISKDVGSPNKLYLEDPEIVRGDGVKMPMSKKLKQMCKEAGISISPQEAGESIEPAAPVEVKELLIPREPKPAAKAAPASPKAAQIKTADLTTAIADTPFLLAKALSDHTPQVDDKSRAVSQNIQGAYAIKQSRDGKWVFDIPNPIEIKKGNERKIIEWLKKYSGMTPEECEEFCEILIDFPENVVAYLKGLGKGPEQGLGDSLGAGGHRICIETNHQYGITRKRQIDALVECIDGGADVICIQEQPYDIKGDEKRKELFARLMDKRGYVQVSFLEGRDVGIWVKKKYADKFTSVKDKELIKLVEKSILRGCMVQRFGVVYVNLHVETRELVKAKGQAWQQEYVDLLLELKQKLDAYATKQKPTAEVVIMGDLNLFAFDDANIKKLTDAGFGAELVKGQAASPHQAKSREAYVLAQKPVVPLDQLLPEKAAPAEPKAAKPKQPREKKVKFDELAKPPVEAKQEDPQLNADLKAIIHDLWEVCSDYQEQLDDKKDLAIKTKKIDKKLHALNELIAILNQPMHDDKNDGLKQVLGEFKNAFENQHKVIVDMKGEGAAYQKGGMVLPAKDIIKKDRAHVALAFIKRVAHVLTLKQFPKTFTPEGERVKHKIKKLFAEHHGVLFSGGMKPKSGKPKKLKSEETPRYEGAGGPTPGKKQSHE